MVCEAEVNLTMKKLPNCVLFALIWVLMSMAFAQTSPPTPELNQKQDFERYYQEALKGEQIATLTNNTEQFLALKLEQRTSNPQGGVLILHDRGHNPDWPFLLQQTRHYLPDVGWTSLSISLPTPQQEASGRLNADGTGVNFEEETDEAWQQRILERIATGIADLNRDGLLNIAIIGYGDGAYWGARYLAERLTPEEEEAFALVMIEPALHYDDLTDYMGTLNVPILDLFMNDHLFATSQAKQRLAEARRNERDNYLQIHDASRQNFYGAPSIDRTTRRIWGWLNKNAAGQETTARRANNF